MAAKCGNMVKVDVVVNDDVVIVVVAAVIGVSAVNAIIIFVVFPATII